MECPSAGGAGDPRQRSENWIKESVQGYRKMWCSFFCKKIYGQSDETIGHMFADSTKERKKYKKHRPYAQKVI